MRISFTCISHGFLYPKDASQSWRVPYDTTNLFVFSLKVVFFKHSKKKNPVATSHTPPKFNMEPENNGFQMDFPFPGTYFHSMLNFGGVYPICTAQTFHAVHRAFVDKEGRSPRCWSFELWQSSNDHCNSTTQQREWNFAPQFRRNMFQTLKSEGGRNAFQMQSSCLQGIVLFVKITALEYT